MLLSFLGLVFIAFIGKFIWDTYVTGKTDRDYQVNLRSNPEQMARMQNNVSRGEYLNFNYSPKRSQQAWQASLEMIAKRLGCEPADTEKYWKEQFIKLVLSDGASDREAVRVLERSITPKKKEKHDEAIKRIIDPDDTTAAIVEGWTKELIESFNSLISLDDNDTVSRGEYLNFNYSPTHNPAEKAKSLALMANNFDCEPAEAEEKFIGGIFNEMVLNFTSQAEVIQVLSDSLPQIKQNKYNEATERVIDPDDTFAALHEAWTKEAIRRLELVVAEDKKRKEMYDDEASWYDD